MQPGLSEGTYSVTVTDAQGATGVLANVPIGGPPSPVSYTEDEVTEVTCFGGADGGIGITPLGGNGGPYTFIWSNGGGMNEDPTSLPAGDYYC